MPDTSNPWLPPHLQKPYSSSTATTAKHKYLIESHPLPPRITCAFDFPPLVLGARDVAPWEDLPADIVRAIAHRLTASGYLRTLAVCVSWASTLRHPLLPLAPHFPFLALTCKDTADIVHFVSLLENRCYRLPLPGKYSTVRCVGCRGGWLVYLHHTLTVDALIVNPITRDMIRLPSLSVLHRGKEYHLRCEDVVKIVLSDDMSVAMLLYKYRYLAFARTGDDMWTKLYFPLTYTVLPYGMRRYDDSIDDVAYHKGKFYAIFTKGHLRSIDLAAPSPRVKLFKRSALSDEDGVHGVRRLASTACGDLLRVREERCGERVSVVKGFVIKRFDPEVYSCWHEVTDRMGGCALFYDRVQVTAVRVNDVPGMEGNRIYFAGNVADMMFDIAEGEYRPCFSSRTKRVFPVVPPWNRSHPVWCMPSLL